MSTYFRKLHIRIYVVHIFGDDVPEYMFPYSFLFSIKRLKKNPGAVEANCHRIIPKEVWKSISSYLDRSCDFLSCLDLASSSGDIQLLDFVHDFLGVHFVDNFSDLILSNTSQAGQVSTLEWMVEKEYSLTPELYHFACIDGHFGILKFLFESGCVPDDTVLTILAKREHWDCLRFGIRNHFPVDGTFHHFGNKLAFNYKKTCPYIEGMDPLGPTYQAAIAFLSAESIFDDQFPDLVRLDILDRFGSS